MIFLYRVIKTENPLGTEISQYIPTVLQIENDLDKIEEIEPELEEEEKEFAPEEDVFEEEFSVDDIIQKAIDDAEEIIMSARAVAAKITEEAKTESEREYIMASRKGEQDGYAEGLRRATVEAGKKLEDELTSFKARIEDEIYSIQDEKQKLLDLYLEDLKNVSLSIGEKIVQTSLKSSKDVIERMILVATEKMKKVSWAKIYIGNNPESQKIQGDAAFLKSVSRIADSVKIVVIDENEAGTCIIETPETIMDISVKTQLENIKEILNNARL